MNDMKRIIILFAALMVMGMAVAQNPAGHKNTKEYVSVLLTFTSRDLPTDSLNAYGVIIQSHTGLVATALIPAQNYKKFLYSGIADRVQPTTRVVLPEGHSHTGTGHVHDNSYRPDVNSDHRPPRPDTDRPERDDQHPHHQPGHHPHHPAHHHGQHQQLIPEEEIEDDEARGCYLGIMLGDTRNRLRVEQIDQQGTWYPAHGIDGELLLGYQFNRWFGLRTAAQFMYKNYSTDLNVMMDNFGQPETKTLSTSHRNVYVQAPLLMDFSIGGRNARLHMLLGGYCGYWMTQYRNGWIYSPEGTTGVGYKSGFEVGYDEHLDAGAAAGLGLTFRLSPACLLHFEGMYYHGMLSTKVEPNKTFNRTSTLGMGISYHF